MTLWNLHKKEYSANVVYQDAEAISYMGHIKQRIETIPLICSPSTLTSSPSLFSLVKAPLAINVVILNTISSLSRMRRKHIYPLI